jgi:hypothetical protein
MPQLKSTLADVAGRLDRSGANWGIFAGAAGVVYGVKRRLRDIDILIPTQDMPRVAALFPDAQREHNNAGRVGTLMLNGIELIAGLTQYIALEMDAPMITRLQRASILEVDVSVIGLEDNLAIKAMFGRGPEQGKHDWADITEMLVDCPDLDWDYLGWRLENAVPLQAQDLLARLQTIYTEGSCG